jgi:protocatechuate 3,4-dioxygenase beta subunit
MAHEPRRTFCRNLATVLFVPALLPIVTRPGVRSAAAAQPTLPATPSDVEGPFYKTGAPQRGSLLEPNMPGTRLVVTGRVLSTDGAPLKSTKVDFWQTDAKGDYDNKGFRLRGYQLTDNAGRYRLETIVPGAYPGRTRHIHVKVQAPNGRPLTTQLYFANDPRNRADSLYNPALVMQVRDAESNEAAAFDFVLR